MTKRLIIQKKALYICPEQNAQRQILIFNFYYYENKTKNQNQPQGDQPPRKRQSDYFFRSLF